MKSYVIIIAIFCGLMAMSGAAWCADNGDGTVTLYGLVWLKDGACLGGLNYDSAVARVKTLEKGQCGLTDKSKAGAWRLPTATELAGIWASRSEFSNISASYYWSSTPSQSFPDCVWGVNMSNARTWPISKADAQHTLAVR